MSSTDVIHDTLPGSIGYDPYDINNYKDTKHSTYSIDELQDLKVSVSMIDQDISFYSIDTPTIDELTRRITENDTNANKTTPKSDQDIYKLNEYPSYHHLDKSYNNQSGNINNNNSPILHCLKEAPLTIKPYDFGFVYTPDVVPSVYSWNLHPRSLLYIYVIFTFGLNNPEINTEIQQDLQELHNNIKSNDTSTLYNRNYTGITSFPSITKYVNEIASHLNNNNTCTTSEHHAYLESFPLDPHHSGLRLFDQFIICFLELQKRREELLNANSNLLTTTTTTSTTNPDSTTPTLPPNQHVIFVVYDLFHELFQTAIRNALCSLRMALYSHSSLSTACYNTTRELTPNYILSLMVMGTQCVLSTPFVKTMLTQLGNAQYYHQLQHLTWGELKTIDETYKQHRKSNEQQRKLIEQRFAKRIEVLCEDLSVEFDPNTTNITTIPPHQIRNNRLYTYDIFRCVQIQQLNHDENTNEGLLILQDDKECRICFNTFDHGDIVVSPACNHSLCFECFVGYLQQGERACPYCFKKYVQTYLSQIMLSFRQQQQQQQQEQQSLSPSASSPTASSVLPQSSLDK